uniref:NR LBD domain-containing protein n=1 Tax=Parastrongyloides trichosuri TaxID=131310 RepID=A0A0N4ZHH6_PARTI
MPIGIQEGNETIHACLSELFSEWHLNAPSTSNFIINQSSHTHQTNNTGQWGCESNKIEDILRHFYKIKYIFDSSINVMTPIDEDGNLLQYYDEWNLIAWNCIGIINRSQGFIIEEGVNPYFVIPLSRRSEIMKQLDLTLKSLANKAIKPEWFMPKGIDEKIQISFTKFNTFYNDLYEFLLKYCYTEKHEKRKIYSNHCYENIILTIKNLTARVLGAFREFSKEYCSVAWKNLKDRQVINISSYPTIKKKVTGELSSFYTNTFYFFGIIAIMCILDHNFYSGIEFCQENNNIRSIFQILKSIYVTLDKLLLDSIACNEPNSSPILVTNNLFPISIDALAHCVVYNEFNLQIVSEEVAQQIQNDIRRRKLADYPITSLGVFRSAALLAMKPSTGVKRNNAVASADGGNTAHKKSDVNSKEIISIKSTYDPKYQTWTAVYPHLLCTTRQKDTLIDSRANLQSGKRPLFYFHIMGKLYSPSGQYLTVHTLSLPFTIATRRNQDCQVQRMMSSYTATCFWLYGTYSSDGLILNWCDNGIDWKQFKNLYSRYFSANAECKRTLIDRDFNVFRGKMKCNECNESTTDYVHSLYELITFKNVLCPHLHSESSEKSYKFSIWRGMLELLHLFNDNKTEVKTLWENGIIYGFLDFDDIGKMIESYDSILLIHISFVISACICFVIKNNDNIVYLEPLDLKKLQSKSLIDYFKDIVVSENVKNVYSTYKNVVKLDEVLDLLKINLKNEYGYENSTKTVSSNAIRSGNTNLVNTIEFTNLRVTVVACRSNQNYTNSFNSPHYNVFNQHIHHNVIKQDNLQMSYQNDNNSILNSPYEQDNVSQRHHALNILENTVSHSQHNFNSISRSHDLTSSMSLQVSAPLSYNDQMTALSNKLTLCNNNINQATTFEEQLLNLITSFGRSYNDVVNFLTNKNNDHIKYCSTIQSLQNSSSINTSMHRQHQSHNMPFSSNDYNASSHYGITITSSNSQPPNINHFTGTSANALYDLSFTNGKISCFLLQNYSMISKSLLF